MKIPLLQLVCVGLVAGLAGSAEAGRKNWNQPNYDKSKIAPYTLEDPLAFADGRKLKDASEWPARRQEILGIFAKEMFGQEPPKPDTLIIEKFDEGPTQDGLGIRQQYQMWFRKDKTGPSIDWLVLLPAKATGSVPTKVAGSVPTGEAKVAGSVPTKVAGSVPVILFLNYAGNHELITDPQVRVPANCWLRGKKNHQPSAETRGVAANLKRASFIFPAKEILSRGYAVISACYGQVSPDPDRGEPVAAFRQDPFAYTGVFDLWPKRDPARTDNTTAIGAWAWALSRGLDLATRIPQIDARRSVATGYSRLAKTALLAAARDDRFAICVPNQTGGGGCPLAKRDYGENIGTEMRSFSHWYCAAYKKYEKDPAKLLTFDQHLLLASIAPRALLVQGFDNAWFDTEGEYLACRAAAPVWTFLGKQTLPDKPFPADYDTSCIGRYLGYVRRNLWHGHSADDWKWLLNFVDGVFSDQK